jgi:hypothetical protein
MTRPCGRGVKRRAEVSRRARGWAERVSKADLLEAALSLASLCSGADSCDDEEAALDRLVEEVNLYREGRGARKANCPGDA